MSRLPQSLAVVVFSGLVLANLCFDVKGAEFRADKSVHIKADEVIDGDLYAFGEHVTIEGTVKGDLIAAGRHVVVKGTVERFLKWAVVRGRGASRESLDSASGWGPSLTLRAIVRRARRAGGADRGQKCPCRGRR